MFDIRLGFYKLLKSTERVGGKKENNTSLGNTDFMYFFHTQLAVFLPNMSPKLAVMSVMDVPLKATLQNLPPEDFECFSVHLGPTSFYRAD